MQTSNFKHLTIERDEKVAVVTINRPEKRNALSPEVLQEITAAFEALPQDTGTNVIVFTGGERYFSAGFDLNLVKVKGWHHITVTCNNLHISGKGALKFYIDGEVTLPKP